MTEEEKKAVEFIKKEIKNLEEAKIEFSYEIEGKGWLKKHINELDNDIFYKNTLLNLIEKLQKEKDEILNAKVGVDLSFDDYIPKDKIREIINEDLPDDEICEVCEKYDVNGVVIKQKLIKVLEEEQE